MADASPSKVKQTRALFRKHITNLSAKELQQGNNREQSEHWQVTSKSYCFCCDRIRRSAILNWRTVRDSQKHIASRSSLPVIHFFRRYFFHL